MKVEPIRNQSEIKKVLKKLSKSKRNKLLFVLGIYTGFRVSDLLKLKLKDIAGVKISVKEEKTGKQRVIVINETLKNHIDETTKYLKPDDYLFKSNKTGKPITRNHAHKIIKEACEKLNINAGTHTMRKTFAYWHYKQYGSIEKTRRILNHGDAETTKEYIGILQEEIDNEIYGLNLEGKVPKTNVKRTKNKRKK